MNVIPQGAVECPECAGQKVMVYSCCTGEAVSGGWEDIMMCPKCHEHLGEEDCVTCEGRGWIIEEDEELEILKPTI